MGAESRRWEGRPRGALAIRVAATVVPVVAGVLAASVVSRLLPEPSGLLSTLLWWLAVVGSSTITLVLVDRQARRLLPLAALLKVSLVFPDRAPSRFKVALRAGTVRNLQARLEDAKRRGREDDPGHAAEAILVLAGALSRHDSRTRGHSERVRGFADLIAEEMGLPAEDRDRLRWAALLHDIGKVQVHPEILNKAGTLSDEEWEAIHRHPIEGARVTAPLRSWLGECALTIEQHHERWDGTGYPRGLAGNQISRGARIVAVADAFEVMTAARPYSHPMGTAAARDELARCAGTHFDPEVVRAFLNVSIGRTRWITAPIAWLAELPFVQQLAHVGSTAGTAAASTAGTAVGTSASVALAFLGGVAEPPQPAAPPSVPPVAIVAPPVASLVPTTTTSQPAVNRALTADTTTPIVPNSTFDAPGSWPPSGSTAGGSGPSRDASAPALSGGSSEAGRGEGGRPTGAAPATRTTSGTPTTTKPTTTTTTSTTTTSSTTSTTTPPSTTTTPPPNVPPQAMDDAAATRVNRPVKVNVLANDRDPGGKLDPRTLRVVAPPGHGTAAVEGRAIEYSPAPDFRGVDTFQYQICDRDGDCAMASVRVTVG